MNALQTLCRLRGVSLYLRISNIGSYGSGTISRHLDALASRQSQNDRYPKRSNHHDHVLAHRLAKRWRGEYRQERRQQSEGSALPSDPKTLRLFCRSRND
jgi:hypothetical protein